MNRNHKVWSLMNFDNDFDYINNIIFVTVSKNINLSDYIETIYDNMKYKVENGFGCAIDSKLNDMSNIMCMININNGSIDRTPFIGCKFIRNMNSDEVDIVRFADDKINDIMGYVAGAFRKDFCKKADIIESNMDKNDIITRQYRHITYLMSRIYDDRIINFNKVSNYIENIKSFIIKEFFEDPGVDIHKLTSSQLSILTRIDIKTIQTAARSGRLSGVKEGEKWYFDYDIVSDEIYEGKNNDRLSI